MGHADRWCGRRSERDGCHVPARRRRSTPVRGCDSLTGVADDVETAAVSVRGVTKRFDDVVAVDDVAIDIGDGEFFSLLGPSGCGKTTMLRMIAGLDFPTEGSIAIFGEEVADTPPHRRPVNTVFQQYALFPHLDVASNVEFGLRMQKVERTERRRRVAEALALVRLDGLERRKPDQLSGGQQQRVALARALVNRPKVLLLDEPLGALDLQLRQDMQGELKSLQRELGISFVFVTHDQEEALTMSDRIAVMRSGRILQVGRPEEVYERPADRFVADFIGSSNLLGATVAEAGTVALSNGRRVAAATDGMEPGTKVSLVLRPERVRIEQLGADDATPHGGIPTPDDGRSLTGVVTAATYLGNAIVYRVTIDWIHVEVRAENRPGDRIGIGSDVELTWAADAVTVLADQEPDRAADTGDAT